VTADLDPMKAVLVFQTIRQLCVKDIDSPRSKRCEGESVSLTSVRVIPGMENLGLKKFF